MSLFRRAFSGATTGNVPGACLLTPLGRHAHLALAWKEGFQPQSSGLSAQKRARGAMVQDSHPVVAGKRARPGTWVPARPPTLYSVPSSSQLLAAPCPCLPGCSLGPPAPPTPPLTHPVLRFVTTARDYLNCLLFLALRRRERSLPDSGAPLLPRGPRGDSLRSVSWPAQPPALSPTRSKTRDQNEGDKRHRKMGLGLGVFV